MTRIKLALWMATALAGLIPAAPALAGNLDGPATNLALSLTGSIGAIALEGREYVFNTSGSSDILSLLIWQSQAPVLTTGLDVRLPDGWTLTAKGQIAMSGQSYMEDYDWLTPYRTNFDFNNWTHRSQHPNTNLDWYFNGSVTMGRDFAIRDGFKVNLNSGFKYTTTQWAANGGTYIYSVSGFRDTTGTIPAGPAITYRQDFPILFAGADAELKNSAWTFNFGAQLGVTFGANARDHHWQRVPPLRFEDKFYPAPVIAVNAGASYKLSEGLDVFIAGTFDKIFLARGDTQVFNNTTGALTSASSNTAGTELVSATLSTGLKGSF